MVKLRCLSEKCGKTFLLPAKLMVERKPAGFNSSYSEVVRTVVEKPCCPYCEGLEFEEVS